jgi:hypothetical protein
LITRTNEKEKKQSKRKSSKEHNKSLSLITKALCGIGRGFDHFGVSCIECLALISSWKMENFDDLNEGWLGVFIAPTTKLAVGEACCRMAHRTVRCTPNTVRCASHVTRSLGFDRWSSDWWGRLVDWWCTGQVL